MPVHSVILAENFTASKRALTTGRAYPLGEADRPARIAGTAAELGTIVRYLNVESSLRYQPSGAKTFCNIYACDYCYLAGAYLPRVWWSDPALAAERDLPVKYGDTVVELNANSLCQWLFDFGPRFGWTRVTSLEDLQGAANAGRVGVICARRKELSKSGHISVIVPEQAPAAIAQHSTTGIRVPLQSQAGRTNYCFSCKPGRWWESSQFQAFGFWTHA